MITIHVNASKPYDVILKAGVLSEAGALIRDDLHRRHGTAGVLRSRRACIVTDETVGALYGGLDQALAFSLREAGFSVSRFVFPGGEDHKNMETVAQLLNTLTEQRFSRSDLLVALGGGITGDITGFAAAIYLRGIDFVQIPTSLLAAVDSSVGGKTGVNLPAGKNLAGAFWQPNLVLFDPAVMTTLGQPLLMDGMAEILKAGFIADNTVIYDALMAPYDTEEEDAKPGETSDNPSRTEITENTANLYSCLRMGFTGALAPIFNHPEAMIRLIGKAVGIKRRIVEEDEREGGTRRLLNLGHTIGHAIEKCSDYEISHGAAVAMGTGIVARASQASGWTAKGYGDDINAILRYFGYDLVCPFTTNDLAEAAQNDKKTHGTQITLVIPDYPGHCSLKDIPTIDLEKFIRKGM